jgi:beta-1,4-mannosyltransferase
MKILVFPAYTNPYQSLLYGAMAALRPDLEVSYSRYHRTLGSLPLLTSLPWKRFRGYRLLHIHWPSFGLSRNGPLSRHIASLMVPLTIYFAKLLGFRLVWTVHNVLPHEPQTLDDAKAARFLSRNVDAKIVLSHPAIRDMRCHGLDVNHVWVIPHGNYLGVYPDVITRSAAREHLAVRDNEILLLFFGRMRPYKGVSDLLSAFDRLNCPAAKLLLAGRVLDQALQREIRRATQKSNVIAHEGHVSDKDVATYFKASDVVCLPFRAITNSGSALLALSFARPIVAPRSGSLNALPSSVGYLYDPTSPGALDRSLADAISDHGGRAERGRAARAYAATLRWDAIAADTLRLYAHLLSSAAG